MKLAPPALADSAGPVEWVASSDATSEVNFEQVVRNNIAWMLVVAKRILREKPLSEDAVQMAFAKIHEKLDKFEGRSSLRTWMLRIVVNEALMLLRKQKRKKVQLIDPLLSEFAPNGYRIDEPFVVKETPEDQLQSSKCARLYKIRLMLCRTNIASFLSLGTSKSCQRHRKLSAPDQLRCDGMA